MNAAKGSWTQVFHDIIEARFSSRLPGAKSSRDRLIPVCLLYTMRVTVVCYYTLQLNGRVSDCTTKRGAGWPLWENVESRRCWPCLKSKKRTDLMRCVAIPKVVPEKRSISCAALEDPPSAAEAKENNPGSLY